MNGIALRLRLVIGSTLILAACGGGGSSGTDASGSALPPIEANGALSVSITDPAGVPVQQVLVNVSGAGTASGLTNSSGTYSFPILAMGTYTTIPTLAPGVSFAPASISVAVSNGSTATAAFVATYSTTAQIANQAAALHSQMLSRFASDDQAIANQFAPTFGALSGARFKASMADFNGVVQLFVASLLVGVQTQAQTMPVDYPAVSAMLTSYATQDSAFVSAYFGGNAIFNSLVTSTQLNINSTYAVAKASLP